VRAGWRCEYCLLPEEHGGYPHHVDHIVSRKHGGESGEDNLAFACPVCNRNKGTDVASLSTVSGQPIRLFHPRQQAWPEHFQFVGPRIDPLSETGEATVRLLRLDDRWRVQERAASQLAEIPEA